MGLQCPKCSEDTSVIDSRTTKAKPQTHHHHYQSFNGMIRRRRACQACGYRFSTFELSQAALMQLVEAQRDLERVRNIFGQPKDQLNVIGGPAQPMPELPKLGNSK